MRKLGRTMTNSLKRSLLRKLLNTECKFVNYSEYFISSEDEEAKNENADNKWFKSHQIVMSKETTRPRLVINIWNIFFCLETWRKWPAKDECSDIRT